MGNYKIFEGFENPRRVGSKKFYNKCSENSRSQIVFRTDIFQKSSLGAPAILSDYQLCLSKIELYICAFSNGLNLLK